MELYSTRSPSQFVGLREAVLRGLPADNGLYMPREIPRLPASFFQEMPALGFPELAVQLTQALIGPVLPPADLEGLVREALSFDAPLRRLDAQLSVLELFHGPTLAFKDFGARFMARLLGYFQRDSGQDLTVLVATSGDTGGAVAAGFHQTPGIQVVILYPSGKVSPLQEKQLTTLGGNVSALEIEGSFDDCQAMVKRAFLDAELCAARPLSSANSINIARLIPQSWYYFRAWQQAGESERQRLVFCTPSGNFGNLTAGLLAKRMGLPVKHFIAATNSNDVIVQYLASGNFQPRASLPTLSNAMDVGNPSNFARLLDLYSGSWEAMRSDVAGFAFDDPSTRRGIRQAWERWGYVADPHGAVGFLAAHEWLRQHPDDHVVVLETAHPAKFPEVVEQELGFPVSIPERLARLRDLPGASERLPARYPALRSWLMRQP